MGKKLKSRFFVSIAEGEEVSAAVKFLRDAAESLSAKVDKSNRPVLCIFRSDWEGDDNSYCLKLVFPKLDPSGGSLIFETGIEDVSEDEIIELGIQIAKKLGVDLNTTLTDVKNFSIESLLNQ